MGDEEEDIDEKAEKREYQGENAEDEDAEEVARRVRW